MSGLHLSHFLDQDQPCSLISFLLIRIAWRMAHGVKGLVGSWVYSMDGHDLQELTFRAPFTLGTDTFIFSPVEIAALAFTLPPPFSLSAFVDLVSFAFHDLLVESVACKVSR